MIKATSMNPHMQHNDRKPNNPSTLKHSAEKSNPPISTSDMLYILDLSAPKEPDEQFLSKNDEPATILDLSQSARFMSGSNSVRENERAKSSEGGDAHRPSDETRRLTRALVAAKSSGEVQSVLSETYSHMREWLSLAATGDEKAIKVVRRIQRLITRGNRKIRDLNKEQVLLIKQQKAEKAEQERLAQRLRDELKQAERMRKLRERRYLQERDVDNDGKSEETGPSMAATEAKIRALAAAMAALNTNANATNVGDSGISDNMPSEVNGSDGSELSGGEISEEV